MGKLIVIIISVLVFTQSAYAGFSITEAGITVTTESPSTTISATSTTGNFATTTLLSYQVALANSTGEFPKGAITTAIGAKGYTLSWVKFEGYFYRLYRDNFFIATVNNPTGTSTTVSFVDAGVATSTPPVLPSATPPPPITTALQSKGNLSLTLTGTVSVTNLSATVTGVGTVFNAELTVGDSIKIGAEIFTISAITSNTSLTLDTSYQGVTASGLSAYMDDNLFVVSNGDSSVKVRVTKKGTLIGNTIQSGDFQFMNDFALTEVCRLSSNDVWHEGEDCRTPNYMGQSGVGVITPARKIIQVFSETNN